MILSNLTYAADVENESDDEFHLPYAADVDNESTESDDEFQICNICTGEEVSPLDCFNDMLSFDVYKVALYEAG